jgi:hypothetical protein
MKRILSLQFIGLSLLVFSQEEDTTKTKGAIEELKYKQQPGLALAASKIFFSDKRYSISGFGEFNYIPIRPVGQQDLGDLELYYSGLYRFATFFGYKLSKKIIWNSEFQIEFLHDDMNESHYEIVIEAFFDFLLHKRLNARIGFYPLTIGYVNNNDEPVMFYSVNRSDVERIITPSTWIEFGTMFYGELINDLSYAIGISQGLNSVNYLSGTWIRQGREIRLDVPTAVSLNPQVNYTGITNLTLSASAYLGNSGQGNAVIFDNTKEEVKARIDLLTGYAKYEWGNFSFNTVGTIGRLSDTDKLHALTSEKKGQGQVLGSQVYGYLFEFGANILPYLRNKEISKHNKTWFWDSEELKLSLFARYERLNTHYAIDNSLILEPRVENDLAILTTGINFNTRENIVFKANYRFARNFYPNAANSTKNYVEFGIGFIF